MNSIRPFLKDKKHVIWDWNGTLLNDIDCAVSVIGELLVEEGLAPISRQEYLAHFGFPVSVYYEKIGFDFKKTSFEILAERFIRNYKNRVVECDIHPGSRELLQEIKSLGLMQSVLSAAEQSHLNEQIIQHRLSPHLDHVYGLNDHYAASKIDRGRELIQKTAIAPTETLLVGDTDHDLEVGLDLGVDVLLLADGHQSFERLQKLHHQVLISRA